MIGDPGSYVEKILGVSMRWPEPFSSSLPGCVLSGRTDRRHSPWHKSIAENGSLVLGRLEQSDMQPHPDFIGAKHPFQRRTAEQVKPLLDWRGQVSHFCFYFFREIAGEPIFRQAEADRFAGP
jgi:hypothetical protein